MVTKIGILVLNQNGGDWLPTVYNSILAQGFNRAVVYLVDNNSKDDSVALTREKYPQVTIIRMPRNLGYCMAYNLAMPYAFADGCDWVIWANNDIKLEAGCLEQLALAAQSDPRIGIVGPAFLEWDGAKPNYYMLGNHPAAVTAVQEHLHDPIDVHWAEGSLLMLSRECAEAVGPLDPYFFMYWEEADFCRRARRKGWRVVVVPSALARHYGGGSSSNNRETGKLTNGLRLRNHYVNVLTDPFNHFTVNFLETLHLFFVLTKQPLSRGLTEFFFNGIIFAGVLRDLSTIYKKLVRDSAGNHPPTLSQEITTARVKATHLAGVNLTTRDTEPHPLPAMKPAAIRRET